jgi:hypothetical protein
MTLEILPSAIRFECASGVRTAVGAQGLVGAFVFTEVTAVCACEVAEAAFVWFLTLVQGRDVGLQLRVRRRRVATAVADVWALAGVGALVVVFGLVGGKGLGTGWVAACVGAVARVAEEVAREFGALLEVFGARIAGLPLAEA